MRGAYQALVLESRRQIAEYVNADVEDIVLVENTSTAVNAVLRSLPLQAGDTLVNLSTAYAMNRAVVEVVRSRSGVQTRTVQLQFEGGRRAPTDAQGRGVVAALEAVLDEGPGRAKLALLDAISSVPCVRFPLEAMLEACKARGVPAFVDAAHSLGQQPVDLRDLERRGCGYWVSNAHKWLGAPRGCAVLWVAKAFQASVLPTVVSSSFFQPGPVDWGSEFQNRHVYTGTRDYTTFCVLPDCLAFRRWVGEAAITTHLHALASFAAQHLAQAWGTEALLPDGSADEPGRAAMVNVRLPLASLPQGRRLQQLLRQRFDMELLVFQLRVSCVCAPAARVHCMHLSCACHRRATLAQLRQAASGRASLLRSSSVSRMCETWAPRCCSASLTLRRTRQSSPRHQVTTVR